MIPTTSTSTVDTGTTPPGKHTLRLVHLFTGRRPARALLLSPALVAATTWLLFSLQTALAGVGRHQIRTFDIGYLIPLLVLTVLGGRIAGVLTLVLSAAASAYVLSAPHFSFTITSSRDRIEILLLMLVGCAVVTVAGVFHDALREMADALMEARLENQIRSVAGGVPGIGRLHSCTVEKAGLDYHVALSVGVCQASASCSPDQLPVDIERALRRANPMITDTHIRIVP